MKLKDKKDKIQLTTFSNSRTYIKQLINIKYFKHLIILFNLVEQSLFVTYIFVHLQWSFEALHGVLKLALSWQEIKNPT